MVNKKGIKIVAWLVEHRAKGRRVPWMFYSMTKDEDRVRSLAKQKDPIVEYRAVGLIPSGVVIK